MGKGKLKARSAQKGTKITASSADTEFVSSFDYPVFCFKHLHPDFGIEQCDNNELAQLLRQIVRLSTLKWTAIQTAPKHGIGSEKISISSINPSLPIFLSGDVNHLLSFRFDGLKPFLCHRNKFVAQVIYIDNKFSVYDH